MGQGIDYHPRTKPRGVPLLDGDWTPVNATTFGEITVVYGQIMLTAQVCLWNLPLVTFSHQFFPAENVLQDNEDLLPRHSAGSAERSTGRTRSISSGVNIFLLKHYESGRIKNILTIY